jgi:hypothetical protein
MQERPLPAVINGWANDWLGNDRVDRVHEIAGRTYRIKDYGATVYRATVKVNGFKRQLAFGSMRTCVAACNRHAARNINTWVHRKLAS